MCAALFNNSIAQNKYPVGNGNVGKPVTDEQTGLVAGSVSETVEDLKFSFSIQCAHRFIENQVPVMA